MDGQQATVTAMSTPETTRGRQDHFLAEPGSPFLDSHMAATNTGKTDITGSGETWTRIRGTDLYGARANVFNGYPGCAYHGPVLAKASFVLTDRYVIVDEHRPWGFALPIDGIDSFAVVPGSPSSNPGLAIRYTDDTLLRSMHVQFRGMFRPPRGGHRAGRAAWTLARRGVPERRSSGTLPATWYSWDVAEQYFAESVVWQGDMSGPTSGRLGSISGPCRAFVTDESLIWVPFEADGVRRIAWDDVKLVQEGEIAGSPRARSVVIGVGNLAGNEVPLHLMFTFPRGDRAGEAPDGGAGFVHALASIGVENPPGRRYRPPWLTTDREMPSLDEPPAPAGAGDGRGLEPAPSPVVSRPAPTSARIARPVSPVELLRRLEARLREEVDQLDQSVRGTDAPPGDGGEDGALLPEAERALAACVAIGVISVERSDARLAHLKALDRARRELRDIASGDTAIEERDVLREKIMAELDGAPATVDQAPPA